ncbi:MAG: tetratricopeptide repeat protein [Symploca sp. SIO2G7]|nr:tetratricopeptide repeat protein [Symploca sp. SIO2G7]
MGNPMDDCKKTQPAAPKGKNRQSRMRSPVPDEYYIETDEAKRLLQRFAAALKEPLKYPLLFNIYGIGGVGKTTLLARLQQAHAGKVDFLRVCFATTPDINTPLKLMGKLHQQAQKLMGIQQLPDAFTQQERQFTKVLSQLTQKSVADEAISSEEAIKINNWFQRFVWLSPTGFTPTSGKGKSSDSLGAGFAALAESTHETEGLQKWIQQLVREHPATKDKPQLQALMLQPVARLTQAFAQSLLQIAQSRAQSLVLVLDTYERAQSYLNRWLWQYLIEDTPLASAPVRLVVVGRQELQADKGWRKLNQERQLLYEVQLIKFSKKQTDNYLKQIGIKHGGKRAKIHKVTQGLPYYLNWVREQQDKGEELDFSQGNQAIAKLLWQELDNQQQQILLVAACCRWFDLAMLQYLLGKDGLGLQQDAEQIESYWEWLRNSDFIEDRQGYYRLDDVARDVFRQSCFQNYRNQFYLTYDLLANYFKQQADNLVSTQSLLPDSYKNEQWQKLIAESLYYSLFGKGKEGLQQYIEQVFVATYVREPDVFAAPFAFISAEIDKENRNLLPQATSKFLAEAGIVLRFGWFFLDKPPKSYKVQVEGENFPAEAVEASIQSLLGYVNDLADGFGKSVGLIYKDLHGNSSGKETDALLQAKKQAEQISTHCRPKLAYLLFSDIGRLLLSVGCYQEALDCYEKTLELGEGNAFIFLSQGVALGNLDRYQEALECFDKAIRLEPNSSVAWIYRSNTLNNLERYEEALESSQQAIDAEPEFITAWVNIGYTLYKLEQYEEVLKTSQQAIDIDHRAIYAWINRGNALRNLGRYEEALAACSQALKISPQEPAALNSQALTLSFLKEFEQAIASIDQAIKRKPQHALYRANRGIILARAGRYTEAIANCEQAIQQDSKEVSGYYAQACCYALQGEIEPAIANLKKAMEIKPRFSQSEAKHNRDFDSIRDEPEFQALLEIGN